MRTVIVLVALASLAACDRGSVYDRQIPDMQDTGALLKIRDGLKPEDRDAWQSIVMAKANPMSKGVTAKTVGEAINRSKARTACMVAHDLNKIPDNTLPLNDPGYEAANTKHINAYNAQVAAYNACLEMPL